MSVTDRLYRRVQMAFATAKITATDDKGPVHKVQMRIPTTGEVIDNVPVLQFYGLASHAMTNTDGMVLFIGGDRSNPVMVGTGNQKYRLRDLKSGEIALYDSTGNVVKLAASGNIEVTCPTGKVLVNCQGGNVEITCPSKIRMITPRLEVTGDIIAGCDSTHVSVLNHRHKDTEPGGGLSGVPQPT